MRLAVSASLLLIAGLAPIATAQEFLPSEELADRILSDHPEVVAANARALASEGEARRLAAGPYEWNLSAGFMQRSVSGVGEFSEYDLGLTRGIRLPGKSDIDQRVGQHGVSAARNAAEDARHQAALRLMVAWLDWLAAHEVEAIAREQAASLEAELTAVEQRLSIDDAAEIEVDMARAAVAEAKASLSRSVGETSRTAARLTAWFPDLPFPASPALIADPSLPDDLDRLRQAVVSNSHEIAYVADLSRRADAVADRARADRMPDPQVGLHAFSERDGEEVGFGLSLSIPLGGGAREAAAQEQRLNANAARQEVLRVQREIGETAETDAIQARSEYLAWTSARYALENSQRVVERSRSGYSIGAVSFSDLLMSERRHLDARLLEADARTRANLAILKLKIDAHELWLD